MSSEAQKYRMLIDAFNEPSYTLDRDIAEIRGHIGEPEYKRQNDDWNAANDLHDEAWDRFTRHKDVIQYRADCAEINGRASQ